MTKHVYVYYSGPTDTTGKNIAEALKASHGKVKPANTKTGVCICWGCKTKESLNMGTLKVLNHPDKIKANRNKYTTLQLLRKAKVNVADFTSADKVMAELNRKQSSIVLPLVGRTNYHQGGKGFWTCLTRGQVKRAIDQGAQYFQNYMDVKTEYRLHVFGGEMINAQKKTERKNMAQAYTEQHTERIKHNAEKKGTKLDEATMQHVLGDLGSRQENPDQIIKSNTRGWKFSQIKSVKSDLQDEAVKALKAVGLDFGAVDCCVLEDDSVAIIEINTGPGLSGSSFDAYIAAFKDYLKPKTAAVRTTAAKPAELKAASVGSKTKTRVNSGTLRHMADMLDFADNDEAEAINSVFGKMFK